LTTSVEPCICGFTHHVFGAAVGELTNLINFLVVVRIFLFLFLFFFLLLPLTSWEAQNNNDMVEERTLTEYAIPSTEEPCAIIVYPRVEGNDFEIKPALLHLVQQNQFSGSPTEDPNLHISTFSRLSVTYKANQEAVRLHLFPFSLKDRANTWFHSLEVGSITSWDQMRRAFLA